MGPTFQRDSSLDTLDGSTGLTARRGRAHLASGDVHEHGKAGRVATLAGDVGPVPGQQLAALGRPPSRSPDAAEKRRV